MLTTRMGLHQIQYGGMLQVALAHPRLRHPENPTFRMSGGLTRLISAYRPTIHNLHYQT